MLEPKGIQTDIEKKVHYLDISKLLDYKALLELFDEGIIVKNEHKQIIYINEKMCQELGYTAEELLGTSGDQFLADDEQREIVEQKRELRKKGISDAYEIKTIGKNNEVRWWHVIGRPFFDENKIFRGSIGIFTDITEKRLAEEAIRRAKDEFENLVQLRTQELRQTNERLTQEIKERRSAQEALKQSEQQFRDIFNSSPDAIFVEDFEGNILDVNEEACILHGQTKEELLGKNICELTPASQIEAMRMRQPLLIKGEMRSFEGQALKKDGTAVPIEVKVSRFQYNGQPALLLHVRDISERIKNQQLLHQINLELEDKVRQRTKDLEEANRILKISENLYRQIARNIPRSAIFIFDKQLRYVLAEGNLVGFISLERELIEGKSIYELFSDEQIKEVEHIYKSAINGASGTYELEQNNCVYQINYLPIRSDEGEVVYGMLMVMDITDLKKIQMKLERQAAELKRSNEELERFAYVASHDLQGPLRTISSYLQLLESRYGHKLEADGKEFIEFSVSGAKRMQRLIQDLLNYSRINTRPKPFTEINLNDLLHVVLKNIETTIQANNVIIEIQPLPVVIGDSNQLMQLFQNLIDNAIKFVRGHQPVVKIGVEEKDAFWQFSIEDNGIGIEEEFKEKIFQIFQRLHSEAEFPGTGIGLAICKKIIHLHGGDIWFESTPGIGTTFYFTISKKLKKAAVS
ncbi:MAG: PAS domain S-box protein [Chitinophagales bacterium]|nr:PAS domain S-box protein [Chitinophagales bacterium]MDW8272608.1 PAS domain S-box protein [Chitinophagales bacterium]